MKWHRASKYHEESDPARFYVAAVKVGGEWRFTLADRTQLVGVFASAAEAKAEVKKRGERK